MQQSSSAPEQAKPKAFAPAQVQRDITLHQALDLYVKHRQSDARLGDHTQADSASRITSIKRHIPSWPLKDVGAKEFDTIRQLIVARPLTARKDKEPQPISLVTVQKWLIELGMAFAWFKHAKSGIGWTAPYDEWRENFNLQHAEAKTIAKRAGDKSFGKVKPTFDFEQMKKLYIAANNTQRLYLLGGICLGWTAIEFSTVETSHLQESDGELYICKERSKTGVETKFWVCPELSHLLKRSISHTPPNDRDLALMTMDGYPLVHGRTDNFKQAWDRLLHKVNKHEQVVPNYPHSRLRKFAGQIVENLSGNHSLAQLLLSHKRTSIAGKNYTDVSVDVGIGMAQQQRMWEVQRQVHAFLKPMFDAANEKAQKKVKHRQAA